MCGQWSVRSAFTSEQSDLRATLSVYLLNSITLTIQRTAYLLVQYASMQIGTFLLSQHFLNGKIKEFCHLSLMKGRRGYSNNQSAQNTMSPILYMYTHILIYYILCCTRVYPEFLQHAIINFNKYWLRTNVTKTLIECRLFGAIFRIHELKRNSCTV